MPSARRSARPALAATAGLAVVLTGISVLAPPASAVSDSLVISEVYGGGGNSGSTWKSDFIEIHNPTGSAVDVDGWSVQWRSATSTSAASVTALSGSVPAGGRYLVKEADGTGGTKALPTPDATGTITMGGSNGTAILANTTVAQNPAAGSFAGSPAIVDLVGVSSNTAENAATTDVLAAPAMSASTSVSRTVADADDNSAEFVAGSPSPSNAAGETEPPVVEPTEATIQQVQGAGTTSPLAGQLVETSGVVTAAYPAGLFGFYLQTPGTGGAVDLTSRTTSDGVFVYYPVGAGTVSVQPGDYVSVVGTVSEYAGGTQISSTQAGTTDLGDAPAPVTPATTSAWPATAAQKESLEGMLVDASSYDFTVADTFSTAQYGEVGLALGDEPLLQPTEVALPGSPEADAVEADNAARGIVLDDASSTNFADSSSSNDYTPTKGGLTPPYVSNTAPVRVGAAASLTQPVILTEGGSTSAPTYRFQPRQTVVGPDNAGSPATFVNTRTAVPDTALIDPSGKADVRIASFNVLNYFTTLGDANDDNVGDGGCQAYHDADGDGNNVRTGCDQRGAWDPQDLQRQQEKIVAAINALDADVVGLMEIENSAKLGEEADEATKTLVAALNAQVGAGTWAANPSSSELPAAASMDVITSAIIYKPAAVTRVGEARALGTQSADDQAFGNAREPIAQAFAAVDGGDPFTVVVNHFKSKGSAGPWPGDTDQGDGQGAGNVSRTKQAEALRDWVASLETSSGVAATFLLGDFNSYSQEDPLRVLATAGYQDAEGASGHREYSYSFDGLAGSLDHVLANAAAREAVTGTDIWNINSGESIALEYSRWNYHSTDFHTALPYRSSDHDPVVVGLDLSAAPQPAGLSVADVSTTYGKRTTVTAKVDPAATGTVQVKAGTKVLGSAPVSGGVATIVLPARSLRPGRTTLTASYSGDDAFAPAAKTFVATVSKARSATRASARPGKVVVKRTKATIAVRVSGADGVTATGKVRISVQGQGTRTVTVRNGRATLKLRKFTSKGTKRVTVQYLGSDLLERSSDKLTIKVRKR